VVGGFDAAHARLHRAVEGLIDLGDLGAWRAAIEMLLDAVAHVARQLVVQEA